jgi:hypothetical protein
MKLTATEYAAKHGRTEREIRRLIKAGRLPYEIDISSPMTPQYRIDENTPYPRAEKPGPKPNDIVRRT